MIEYMNLQILFHRRIFINMDVANNKYDCSVVTLYSINRAKDRSSNKTDERSFVLAYKQLKELLNYAVIITLFQALGIYLQLKQSRRT